MKRFNLLVVVFFLLIGAIFSLTAMAAGMYDKYLTAADIGKATGLKGVKVVPYNPEVGAGGNLNFANSKGDLMLMVRFNDVKYYQQSKAMKEYVKAMVKGVGEEAFIGPAYDPQHILGFKKKDYFVTVSTFFDAKNQKLLLTMDQLIAIGKVIAKRL